MNKIILGMLCFLIGFILPVHAQEVNFGLKGSTLESIGNFELVEVLDLQSSKNSLGKIYIATNQTATAKIDGGVNNGLKRFYNNSIRKNTNQRPIQMRVSELAISEQKSGSTMVAGNVKMKFGYYLKGTFDPVHLVDYESEMNYRRPITRTDLVEQVLNQGLRKSIQFLNDYISDQSASDRRLAKAVRVEIIEKDRKSSSDTVFYHPDRPITWIDFRDRPNNKSKYNAVIFTSLALEGTYYMEEGTVVLPLEVQIYMLPESSWVKPGGQNDYSLNHEQRHFDVTRIVGNRLADRLRSMDLNPDNYDAAVNEAFFDAFREMNRLQEIYDGQTQHGMDRIAQSRWNDILDEALKGNMERLELEIKKGK